MARNDQRLIISFYSENKTEAHRAFDIIRKRLKGDVWLLNGAPAGNGLPSTLERYRSTLVNDEYIVAGRVLLPRDQPTLNELRLTEGASTFILNEVIAPHDAAPGPAVVPAVSLESVFRALAESHAQIVDVPRGYFARLIERTEGRLSAAYESLRNSIRLGHAVTTTGEWLLDNNYLFEVNSAEIKAHLPRRFGQNVGGVASEGGCPRILSVAKALAVHLNYTVDAASMVAALQAYQSKSTLNVAELWLFPAALRLAMLEGASQVASRTAYVQDTREFAYFWTNRLLTAARAGTTTLDEMLENLKREPLLRSEQFINVLAEQLHEEDLALARFQDVMSDLLPASLSEVIRREHQAETSDRIRVANAVGSLRRLGQIDFTEIFVQVSRVEETLNADPAGNYSQADFATRNRCRAAVERLAQQSGVPELEVARRAIARAASGDGSLRRHVEYYLIGPGLIAMEQEVRARPALSTRLARAVRRVPTLTYVSLVCWLTALTAILFVAAAAGPRPEQEFLVFALGLAALFPLSEFAIQVVNALIVSTMPPAALPKMDFDDAVPDHCPAMVAVPMMLGSASVVDRELEKLERRYLGNRHGRICFALLADFLDAPARETPADEALLQRAMQGIDALRERHPGGRFYLFHRPREWSESEQSWIGRERKRGKIEDLNALLCGEPAGMSMYPHFDEPIRYVISLDADTELPAGSAVRLIETIAHPLNRVCLADDGRTRLSGYTIIQPRISIGLPGASVTRFTRIFADARGTDPYCNAVSDLYQDLFNQSIFHGKAIYDVQAMHAILHRRFPAETILSHDLIEGAHVGVAAASQVELFENLPTDYPAFARRQHRWIRGDWQISPWIGAMVPTADGRSAPNPLPAVNRWQILDNLRRSLVPPVSMLMLFLAWLFSPSAGVSTLLIALAVGIPSLAPVVDRLARNASNQTHGTIGLLEEIQRTIVYYVLLPHQAWLSVDAIARYLYRRFVSHRHLLEWQTAESADASSHHSSATLRQCFVIAAVSVLLIFVLSLTGRLTPALPFLVLWATSPLVVVWLSQPVPKAYPQELPEEDTAYLRTIARRIWRTFDDLVGPESSWLPPDNTQLALRVEVAQRTSPTNIGLWFTSLLAASDFGFITPDDVLERGRQSIDSLESLERYETHWLNWYGLPGRQPLEPRYVSTVDSGNLLVSLWVLEQGLRELAHAPLPGSECLTGMGATLGALEEVMGTDAAVALPLQNLRGLLQADVTGHELIDRLRQAKLPIQNLKNCVRWFASEESEAAYWVDKLEIQCNAWLAYCERFLGWMKTLAGAPDPLLYSIHPDLVELRLTAMQSVPSLHAIASGTYQELNNVLQYASPTAGSKQSAWLEQLTAEYRRSQSNAVEILADLDALAMRAEALGRSIDMSFLYDRQRKLFGIGYEVGTPVVYTSHYDLLASECRLASFAAIAKGDVPAEHWQALGRPYVSTQWGQVLLSWSGTMFEYLMPVLFMRPFENSFLAKAVQLAIRVQREHADAADRPWGISEAAYSALDANRIYQYRAFGVPGLGLKPGLEGDWVVSPYSSLLALQIESQEATDNLRALARLNMYGPMGFYESIDYTRPAGPSVPGGVIIYCYMAHHQGMALTALANVLFDGAMQRRFHSLPQVRSVEFLLFERVPSARSLLRHARSDDGLNLVPVKTEEPLDRNPRDIGPVPSVQLLGNGSYSVLVTNAGSGFSRWKGFDIVRWRADTTLDPYGTFFYLRDARTGSVWSPSLQPVGTGAASSVVFSASRARFERLVHSVEQIYEICVVPDDDVEVRRIVFSNPGIRGRVLEITSFVELALAPHASDRAHPAFSKLFVQTEWIPERRALIAHRRQRSPAETDIWAAHMLVAEGDDLSVEYESSREKFIGRNRSVQNPAAMERMLTGTVGTVIDPAFSIRCRFLLEARQRTEISFLTMAAGSREELIALLEAYAK